MKDSTTTFHSYVSLYISIKAQRLTLAVFPVKMGVSKVEYIWKFLDFINDAKVNIEILCLDLCFHTKEVFSVLQEENVPHIVQVRTHSKELKKILRGNHARYARYTMWGTSGPLDLTHVIDVQYLQGKNKKFGNVNLEYVVFGITGNSEGSIRSTRTVSLSNPRTVSGTS